ncbi:MAG: hypothetical protein KGL35_21945 [Bradyrhizobium sp.]|uniref:hypothetical protein n=1 Tax=Bradyrhizobium sp. TaxID=376 RepID=UPI001C29BEED|nr:hypothetical protein [Bradyrhizobium sp.]MBU6463239.1 hypothetical protein [Pseudomonadota bacterium]MDE2068109.1 hypothetical protein [Bradyrhizobium sp.]MDE2471319.1 hypothetical protein [Bradyrhizobium sp.]
MASGRLISPRTSIMIENFLAFASVRQDEQSLKYRAQTYQHDEQFQQVCQATVWCKPVDHPKADSTHDHDDQYAY